MTKKKKNQIHTLVFFFSSRCASSMAYRRKHGPQRSLTFIEDFRSFDPADDFPSPSVSSLPSPQLAAHAMKASAAHRDSSSLSSAYGDTSAVHRNPKHLTRSATYATPKGSVTYEYTSMRSLNEAKYGFWGVLARKAKSILEDDNTSLKSREHGRGSRQMLDSLASGQFNHSYISSDGYHKSENLSVNKGSELASSLHQIGGTIKSALEEGLTMVENRTAGIIQETRKLQIRRKSGSFSVRNQPADLSASSYLYPNLSDHEIQLKASRDVANAMAAKAKLLLRELKTVKADLAFAEERCAQLEEENKLLRESRDKGVSIEDDDLIRLQLETLLEEKGRLARENSIYSRENRFLREIVEYHQLTMQDVLYVDEGTEEVTEVCPIQSRPHLSNSNSPGRISPIISRPSSSNNSANTSPRHLNNGDAPKNFLTAGSASSTMTPPIDMQVETKAASLPSSPKAQCLMRQHSPTPS